MPIDIKTTGWDDFRNGSENIKTLIIGGPGSGKTRRTRSWPKPLLIDCESGRGSLADSSIPYVEVHRSKHILDVLEHLRSLERIPKPDRQFRTVVVDTLDALQRSIKDEWIQDNNAGVFKGFDAWGYLDSKMGMILTRLLNLDYHVIVNVHFKEKGGREEGEQREYGVQLQGALADTIYNDFGLCGWLGTYWEYDPNVEERVQRRGLSFHPTPERPFLKDRYGITPKWMPVTFESGDYTDLVELFAVKADALPETTALEQIPEADPTFARDAVAPMAGGPVEPRAPAEPQLSDLTKPELVEKARQLGISVKGNALKAEIIAAIERGAAPPVGETAPQAPALAKPTPPVQDQVDHSGPATTNEDATPPVTPPATSAPEPVTHEQAVQTAVEQLPATVIDDTPEPEPEPEPEPAETCEECGKPLAGENQDYVQLAWFKFRRKLCNTDYAAARKK